MGYLPAVRRLPYRRRPDLLAEVGVDRLIPVTGQAVEMMQAMLARQTGRRAVAAAPLPQPTLFALQRAAGLEGAWLHVADDDQVDAVLRAAARADQIEAADPACRSELRAWTQAPAGATAGVPASAGSPRAPCRRGGSYAVLHGAGDRPVAWLRGGEALSAVWLSAAARGLAVRPISSVIEVPQTRAALCRLGSEIANPYLVLRIGVPAAVEPLPFTPRRPVSESITATPPSESSSLLR